jgi:hypothetical protein
MSEPILIKLGMYIMPSEGTDHYNQQYEKYSLQNCIVLLMSLRKHNTIFFLLTVSDTKVRVKGK